MKPFTSRQALRIAPLLAFVAIAMAPLTAFAVDFAGVYENKTTTLELEPAAAGGLDGTLTVGDNAFPVKAKADGDTLRGAFTVQTTAFKFTATLAGDTLTLTSDGNVHKLKRRTPKPANPLGGGDDEPGPPNPLNPDTPQPDPPHPTDHPDTPDNPPADPTDKPEPVEVTAAPGVEKVKKLGDVQKDPDREWTVLVYLDGDCDLEQFAVLDMNEMEEGMPENVEVIVLVDRAEGYDESDGDWKDAYVYRLKRDADPKKLVSERIAELGEVNMGDERLLANFIAAGLKTFPAKRHMLIMWNHGGGWTGSANDHDAPGNPTGHDDVSLPELRRAIASGLKQAGKKKLDVVAFDMCLMAQIEIADAVHDLADYMLASEALVPGNGYAYKAMLPELTKHGDDVPAVLTGMVKAFDTDYALKKEISTTLSAMDLSKLPALVDAFKAVIDKTGPTLAEQWPQASRSIFYAENYMGMSEIRQGRTNAMASVDLMDMLRKVQYSIPEFPAKDEMKKLEAALSEFIIANETDEIRRKSTGIAVYAPATAGLFRPNYAADAPLAARTGWAKFLTSLHGLQQQHTKPAKFSNMRITDGQGNKVQSIKPLAGYHFEFTLEGDNVIWTQMWSGTRDADGKVRILDKGFVVDDTWVQRMDEATDDVELIMPKYKDGKTELKDEILGLTFHVSDGEKTATGTIDGSDISSSDQWTMRGLYKHAKVGKDPIPCIFIFDQVTWNCIAVIGLIPQPDGSMMPRPLEPEPDAEITMLHEVIDPRNGKVGGESGGTLKWNQGLYLILATNKPGDYAAVFVAETMSDVRSTAIMQTSIERDPELEEWAKGWGDYRPEMLVGEWEWSVLQQDGSYKSTGRTLKIQATEQAGTFGVVLFDENGKQLEDEMVWIVDREGLPNVRMLNLMATGDGGKRLGAVFICPAFFGVKDGQPRLATKMANFGGMMWGFARKGETVVTDNARFEPVETPVPQPFR